VGAIVGLGVGVIVGAIVGIEVANFVGINVGVEVIFCNTLVCGVAVEPIPLPPVITALHDPMRIIRKSIPPHPIMVFLQPDFNFFLSSSFVGGG
jgi:hypothetical protein